MKWPPWPAIGSSKDTKRTQSYFQLSRECCQVIEKSGERGRNRTFNLLIKSQLLCQLSYAPVVGISQDKRTKIITSARARRDGDWRRSPSYSNRGRSFSSPALCREPFPRDP